MMVHFRKRLNAKVLNEVNELICGSTTKKKPDDKDKGSGNHSDKSGNHGHLILDATCAPADIRYPTDLSLLNEAREKLEAIIDTLYEPLKDKANKPRTYRINARKDYLKAAKARKMIKRAIRKAVGKQLRYVKRDLGMVDRLLQQTPKTTLNRKQQQDLGTIQKLYQQQKTMHETRTHRIDERIVSIGQPHVRPIVRGKASAETEFGAKLSISVVKGYARVEKLSWENYNEGIDLLNKRKSIDSDMVFTLKLSARIRSTVITKI